MCQVFGLYLMGTVGSPHDIHKRLDSESHSLDGNGSTRECKPQRYTTSHIDGKRKVRVRPARTRLPFHEFSGWS